MPEPYLAPDGSLVSEEDWRSFVNGLARIPERPERNRKLVLQELQVLLENAVRKRIPRAAATAIASGVASSTELCVDGNANGSRRQGGGAHPDGRIGLLFSGGVDSTLIGFLLRRLGVPFTCIAVGFRDGTGTEPEDIVESRRFARALGFDLEVIIYNIETIEGLFRRTGRILGPELTTVINIGVGAVEVAAIEKGMALGITRFFGGLGAEELFAGYDRHARAYVHDGLPGLAAERVAGLSNLRKNDLLRDDAIARALGVTVATPFLDEGLTRYALSLPATLLIDPARTFPGRGKGDVPEARPVKKLILREAAEAMGLPHDAAFRPKRAAQYGSRTNNALTALRKRAGFRDKTAYLASLFAP